jgi:hypothetical protein
LIVASDNCYQCRLEKAHWLRLVASLNATSVGSIDFVSVSGVELLRELIVAASDRTIPYRAWLVPPDAVAAFSAATGILSVPTTLVLDPERRMRLRVGRSTTVTERLVLEHFARVSN